ncbi:terpenoid synthase [Phlebopus sp. FC_14]|nr:terpenoid synthase [Phlebopus sp. FC_14]
MSSQNIQALLAPLRNPSSWTDTSERIILEPFAYIASKPGKEIRTLLIEAFNIWLAVPRPQLDVISRVVRMLHSASLMVDDIEDGAQLRRGQPVAHRIYGIPQTINTANYVYFLAYRELATLRDRIVANKDLDLVVTDELLSLHRGQGLEIFWRDSLQCPTEEEYISMVNNKTGGLFRVAIKLMMACATQNCNVDYVPLVNLFGVYFQIRDDYMNLQSTEYSHNKGFAEDLTEGKFSFPIVHGVRADENNRVIMSASPTLLLRTPNLRLTASGLIDVLQKRPTTPTLKRHTISHLQHITRSFEYTLKVMSALEQEVRVRCDDARLLGYRIRAVVAQR